MNNLRDLAGRLTVFGVLPAAVWLAIDVTLPIAVALNLFDATLLFASIFAVSLYAPKTWGVLRAKGDIDKLQWFTMGLFYISVSFILAVVWSVRWRAMGHASAFGEDDLRGAFRFSAILGQICLIVSQGDYSVPIPPRRWATVLALILGAVAVVTLALYGDAIRDRFFDNHPGDPHDLAETSEMRHAR